MRRSALVLSALTLTALLQTVPAAAQVSVDELEVFLQPGAATSGMIRVTNDGDQPTQVLVDVQDWRRQPTGANEFLPFGSLPSSCGDRLQVFPLALRLEPLETQPLRVTFTGDSTDSCWNVVFVQADRPQTAADQSRITYVVRTGVKVYVEPARAARAGEIERVELLPDSAGTRRARVSFRNLGEVHVKSRGALEVRRADNTLAARIDLPEFPLEPGALRQLVVVLPALAPGQYVALAMIDYGGADIAAGQLELVVR